MSKAEDFYWRTDIVRTLDKIKDCATKQKFSCVHQPLLDIPLDNVVLDELQLMLRVTGEPFSIKKAKTFVQVC